MRAALVLVAAVSLAVASDPVLLDPEGNCHVRMRRMTHRTRRFIAPGASWKLEFGAEIFWSGFEIWARIPVVYQLDDLFSGRMREAR